jgi:ribonuclease P protein component
MAAQQGHPAEVENAMQRRNRLVGIRRFAQIHREGTSTANRLLVIRVLPNGLDWSRFGFMISKRIGNAVVRNRVKRRLREAVRTCRLKSGWDTIFIARRGSEKASYQELKLATDNLLRRNHLVDGEGETAQGGSGSGVLPGVRQ